MTPQMGGKVEKRGDSPNYSFRVKDIDGRWTRKVGFASYRETVKLRDAIAERNRLIREGLLDPAEDAARGPIGPLLAKWEVYFRSRKKTGEYTEETVRKARAVVEAAGAKRLADLTPGAIVQGIGAIRAAKGFGASTFNHYRTAMGMFLNYLEMEGLLSSNPIGKVETADVAADRRYLRRPLTPDDVRRLIESALAHPRPLRGLAGEDRAWAYGVIYFTGFRKKEVNSLTPESFELDGPTPRVHLRTADEKARRGAELPFPADYVPAFRAWLDRMPRGRPVWRLRQNATREMMAKDLARAGIPYRDERGRHAGLHGFRMTRSTLLVRAGFDIKVVQAANRHQDVRLTLQTYTAEAPDADVRSAVDHLAAVLPVVSGLGRGPSVANGRLRQGAEESAPVHDGQPAELSETPGSQAAGAPEQSGAQLLHAQGAPLPKAMILQILRAKVNLLRRMVGQRTTAKGGGGPCAGS